MVRTCILGMMTGKRRRPREHHRMQYVDNVKDNIREADDRTAWRKGRCAAGAVNVRTDDVG